MVDDRGLFPCIVIEYPTRHDRPVDPIEILSTLSKPPSNDLFSHRVPALTDPFGDPRNREFRSRQRQEMKTHVIPRLIQLMKPRLASLRRRLDTPNPGACCPSRSGSCCTRMFCVGARDQIRIHRKHCFRYPFEVCDLSYSRPSGRSRPSVGLAGSACSPSRRQVIREISQMLGFVGVLLILGPVSLGNGVR